MKDLREITEKALYFMQDTRLNIVPDLGSMRIFDAPLICVASSADPLFVKLKEPEVIGPHHMTPVEWLPGAQAVISYFLPFSQRVRESNYSEGNPSIEWLYGRIEGQMCNSALSRYLIDEFRKYGVEAIAPSLDKRFFITNKRSNWSERHVAYIAGLGTFNLSKSLITQKGCAGRFGSVIVNRKYDATPRPYKDIYEYCTNCGACIDRCPPRAITEKGKNNNICSGFVDGIRKKFTPRYGCGKCQTAVPCEYCIP